MPRPTPHIQVVEDGVIAETVLMPGDPLRAKVLAEKYLDNPVCFNYIRNMYGYTGTYKGKKITVMGSGMGMPSIGIYSYELFKFYGVKRIIRIGSAGSYVAKCKLYDLIVVDKAFSESNFAYAQNGSEDHIISSSKDLTDKILETAKEINQPVHFGVVHSSDVFYREGKSVHELYNAEHGCLAVEMEAFALFHNARVLGKEAACILTISDSFVDSRATTALERQNSFNKMLELALETVIKY